LYSACRKFARALSPQVLSGNAVKWCDRECGHAEPALLSEALVGIRPERVKVAFAGPLPQDLLLAVYQTGKWKSQPGLDSVSLGYVFMWNLSLHVRHGLDGLCGVLPATNARRPAVVSRKRPFESSTCAACASPLPSPANWSACARHPCCLQCALVATETGVIDAFRYTADFSGDRLQACMMPGCQGGGVALDRLLPWMPHDLQTVLHILSRRAERRESAQGVCATCEALFVAGDVAPGDSVALCRLCSAGTCTQCGLGAHPGDACPMSYRRQFGDMPEDVLSEARKQACPGCARSVSKFGGCNHMTCLCGVHWCWVCAGSIDAKDPAAHFSDPTGGNVAAPCSQFVAGTDQEVARMAASILARTDIGEALKDHCVRLLR